MRTVACTTDATERRRNDEIYIANVPKRFFGLKVKEKAYTIQGVCRLGRNEARLSVLR